MTSFQIGISPSRKAAARFVDRVRRTLRSAVEEERQYSGANQSQVAKAIGVHRSVISRELNGRQDITVGRVAEIAWALGRKIEFELVPYSAKESSNQAFYVPASVNSEKSPLRVERSFSHVEGKTKINAIEKSELC